MGHHVLGKGENLGHSVYVNREQVAALAVEHGLMMVSVSDAHRLQEVGRFYTELRMEDLYQRSHSEKICSR